MSGKIGKSDEAGLIGESQGASPSKGEGGTVAQDAARQPSRPDKAGVGKPGDAATRKKERLAAALRDNLKRRKAQMRGRRAVGEDDGDSGNS